MIEGVLVVNEQGRVQLVNTAARRMLTAAGRLRRPSLSRKSSGSRTSPRRLGAALRGDTDRRTRAGAAARIGPQHHRPERADSYAAGAGRLAPHAPSRSRRAGGARPPRHHRASQGGPRAPRFRRQRLTRAAHAADGRSRLRRSPPRRRDRDARRAEIPARSSAATRCGWSGWSAISCGSPGSMRDKSRSSTSAARWSRSSAAWKRS